MLLILGVTHTGYGMLCAQLFCHHAAQHIHLVCAGCGDEQVCLGHSRLGLHNMTDAVSFDTAYVLKVHCVVQRRGALIYNGNIMIFPGKAFGNGITYLAISYYYDIHKSVPFNQ